MIQNTSTKYFPTSMEAVHLLVLYIFLQSLVDFPLALYDYEHDTNMLSESWIAMVSNIVFTLGIYYYGFRKTQASVVQAFALKGFHPALLLPVLLLLPGLQYLVGFLNILVERVLPTPPWFWELFEQLFDNDFGFWGTFVKVSVVAPIVEEALFRGIIMYGLMRNYKPAFAIFFSALLFSLFHLNPWQMTYTFFLGLFLGWLMVKTHSLPLCILAHSINNLIVLLSITYHDVIAEWTLLNQGLLVNIGLSLVVVTLGIAAIHYLSPKSKKKLSNAA